MPSDVVAMTMTGARQFGSTWRTSVPARDRPSARAAVTYSSCFTLITDPRTTRAICGQPNAESTSTTDQMVRSVNSCISTMPARMSGMAKNTSVMRDRIASTQPPRKPATEPTTTPMAVTRAVTPMPVMTEARAP